MNIREKVLKIIFEYAEKHSSDISKLRKFKSDEDSEKCPSSYDYIPSWEQSRTLDPKDNPLSFPFVKEISEIVFIMIFGKDISNINFDLKGHVEYAHGKSWSEIEYYEKNNLYVERLSSSCVKEKITESVFLALVAYHFVEEDKMFAMMNLRENKYRQIFSDIRCKNCDTNVYIDFDIENKKFETRNEKYCPQVNSIFNFSLKVPSKKLVFVNDIREAFYLQRSNENEIGIGTIQGNVLECEEYLKHNVAFINLGSRSIEVAHSKINKSIILDYDKKTYYSKDKNEDSVLNKDFKEEGVIFLNLWGLFILDYDFFKKICEEKGLPLKHFEPVYVNIDSNDIKFKYDLNKLLIEGEY